MHGRFPRWSMRTNALHLLTDSQGKMREVIEERGLNRVVVASCSPRTHEPPFQDTIRKAGLNKYLFEMANIRDQCSWVHPADPQSATEKAKDLVRMSVARSGLLEPLHDFSFEVVQRGLVIGGGMAGMTAARNLADQGFEMVLVEKENQLGGITRRITGPGARHQGNISGRCFSGSSHPNIRVLTEANVRETVGHVGKFPDLLPQGEETVEHGATIVAVGGREHQPEEYLYGKNDRVLTQREFHRRLTEPGGLTGPPGWVVMIQCVGSREEAHPYCSRICCTQAVTNALRTQGPISANPGLCPLPGYAHLRPV